MITVEEARRALMANIIRLPIEVVPFPEAILRYSAEVAHAPHDHPLFDQSAVDGYAFQWVPGVSTWEVVGTVAAGDAPAGTIPPGHCVRILTGGMLPPGTDTVVMQEHVERNGTLVTLSSPPPAQGANVRRRGEQYQQGMAVLAPGTRLGPAATGLLRSVGVKALPVSRQPRITVVITGNELNVGDVPRHGHIFSSNGEMLQTCLLREGLDPVVTYAPDEPEALRDILAQAMAESDMTITTGGVSVGDMDLVRPVLEGLGTRVVFHRVAQKPGKPLLLGRSKDHLIVGLPGNPRAVLVLFWEYVLPAIRAMQGDARPWPRSERLPLARAVEVRPGRAEFRAARIQGGLVHLLRDEGSHMLASLLDADALAYFPAMEKGPITWEDAEVHYLPG